VNNETKQQEAAQRFKVKNTFAVYWLLNRLGVADDGLDNQVDQISFESLLRAAEQACKGKRFRPAVAAFHFYLEHELWTLSQRRGAGFFHDGVDRARGVLAF
jgi:hypothetical protein